MTHTKRSIQGCELLDNEATYVDQFKTKIIHQTWKSRQVPVVAERYVDSWKKFHPQCLHVWWTDADNERLIKLHYPEFESTYRDFPVVIQKVDFVRLLYLHRYGGVYADVDYECRANLFEVIPKHCAEGASVFIAESKFLLNEVLQNSLMVATEPRHQFWVSNCLNCQQIREFLTCGSSDLDSLHEKNESRHILKLFDGYFTKRLSNTLFTLNISGPNLLDKTIVKDHRFDTSIAILPNDKFFANKPSSFATHHQHNSWIDLTGDCANILWVGSLSLVLLLVVVALVFYYTGKSNRKR